MIVKAQSYPLITERTGSTEKARWSNSWTFSFGPTWATRPRSAEGLPSSADEGTVPRRENPAGGLSDWCFAALVRARQASLLRSQFSPRLFRKSADAAAG